MPALAHLRVGVFADIPHQKKPPSDVACLDNARLGMVHPVIRSMCAGCQIEPVDLREVHAMLGAVRLTFRLVPVLYLYAYIKSGSSPWGRVGAGAKVGALILVKSVVLADSQDP